MAGDPEKQVLDALDELRVAEDEARRRRRRFHETIRRAHDAGTSYSALGRALGITRQRVAEIVLESSAGG